jgi:hypothetical protein
MVSMLHSIDTPPHRYGANAEVRSHTATWYSFNTSSAMTH